MLCAATVYLRPTSRHCYVLGCTYRDAQLCACLLWLCVVAESQAACVWRCSMLLQVMRMAEAAYSLAVGAQIPVWWVA